MSGATMRAIVIRQCGGPETLERAVIERPEPGPGEVLVRISHAGVNPADWKAREGKLSHYFDYGFPFVLGFDLCGTVAALGPDTTRFSVGDTVFGTSQLGIGRNGSYAGFTTASEFMLAPLPENLGQAEAAGLPTAGTTAYGGLIDVGRLESGQTVLINGGAGGVGSLAIQIAKTTGARVAATCSAANLDFVRKRGAERAVDYAGEDVVEAVRRWAPGGVDLVLDAVGQDTLLPHALDIVKPGGRYVEIETLLSHASAEQTEAARDKGVEILSNMVAIANLPRHLGGLADMIAEGSVEPPPTRIVPLDEVADAHREIEAGHVRGKIVLEIGSAEGW
ncbi:MAG: NADP-dependent oxidoreductase [Pseudomonadota bacterium]